MNAGRDLAAVVAATVLVAGCGGGGGSSADGSGDATDDRVTSGAITAFGSIVVNGRHIETEGPEVEIEQDGDPVAEAELELGDQVRVDEDDNGRRIEVDEAVRGPVDHVDPNAGTLTVMGQRVLTDAATVFEDSLSNGLDSVASGDVVEVHGLRAENGAISASRVEPETNPANFKVTGSVANHQPAGSSFEIGGLSVDYGSASEIDDDLPGGDASWNGLLVEVEALDGNYTSASQTLLARELDREDPAGAATGRLVEVERIVTAVDGDTITVSGGLQVDISNAAIRLGTRSELVAGARLEIEGRLQSDGLLAASEIKFDDNDVRLSGRVQNDPAAAGNLQVLGVTVEMASSVEFDDDNVEGLSDLSSGDFVEVEGRVGPNTNVIAHEVERDGDAAADEDLELRGPVSSKDAGAGTLEMLGVSVTIRSGTEFELGDAALSRTAFFDRLVLDSTIVQVRWDGGTFNDTSEPPERIEIEHEDEDEDEDESEDEDEDEDEDEVD